MRIQIALLAATAGLALGCKDDDASISEPESLERVDLRNPATCEGCHQQIVQQWRQSMHARAHHERDPLYGGMRTLRLDKEGMELALECAQCHNPQAPSAPDTLAGRAGVACASCHAVARVERGDGRWGARALVPAEEGVLHGPHDLEPNASAVHGTGPKNPLMTDGETLCLACHEVAQNPKGVAVCTTGNEYSKRATDETCVDCHMPWVRGPAGSASTRTRHRSHAFLGPHRAWHQNDGDFLSQAVDLSGELKGRRLQVTMKNRSGHSFPSGFPGRVAELQADGFDAEGRRVFSSKAKPPKGALMNKVYVDEEGKPTLPPFAERLAEDRRLQPDEARTVVFEVSEKTTRVDVRVVYRLAPPAFFQKLGIAERPEAVPRVATSLSIRRAP